MNVLESVTERDLAKWAENHGWVTFKLQGLGKKGKPDRVFFYRGSAVVFMEFKQVKKQLNKLQQWWKRRLGKLGYSVYRVDDFEEGKAILTKAGEPYYG